MIQQCQRWLVPVDEQWAAAPTGQRRHYAPAAFKLARRRDLHYLAKCGTGVSITRTERLKEAGRWDRLIPCQRCVESIQNEVAQYESTNRHLYALLGSVTR